MLQIRNLRKSFGDLQVLKSIDLDVNKGDVVAILGPSGSGKTTMLRCLNFLEKSDGGTMLFDDQRVDLARVTHAEANALRRRTGFVFQSYNLFANKTALQNGHMGKLHQRHRHRDDKRQRERDGGQRDGDGQAGQQYFTKGIHKDSPQAFGHGAELSFFWLGLREYFPLKRYAMRL